MSQLRSVKGMPDRFGDMSRALRAIEDAFAKTMRASGFSEIRTPILEKAEVFQRAVGESSDIVHKEMYAFKDRDKKQTYLTLRPENTASVVRALLQAGMLDAKHDEKHFYIGPMFRRERPQKGRYRQFNQCGAEYFGCESIHADIDVLFTADLFLREIGVKNFKLVINSLGNPESRARYNTMLKNAAQIFADEWCADCQTRLEQNPLRIFDCKVPGCRALLPKLPVLTDALDEHSKERFTQVCLGLKTCGVDFEIDAHLVRGLDYYTDTVFEFVVDEGLGAQNTVLAGGRYDGLSQAMGGPSLPSIGFAAGLERLVYVSSLGLASGQEGPALYLVAADPMGREQCMKLHSQLRRKGLNVQRDLRERSVKAQMKDANRCAAKFTIVIGEREARAQIGRCRNMASGENLDINLDLEAIIEAVT